MEIYVENKPCPERACYAAQAHEAVVQPHGSALPARGSLRGQR